MTKTVKGFERLTSSNTLTNATSFLAQQLIQSSINTSELVVMHSADQNSTGKPAGYGSATPLVCQTDAFDKTLPQAILHQLPYFRPQAGKAAIVMDPQPGDKALAVFTKRDSSNITVDTQKPVQPGSFRSFDQADGFLLNGFLGETPEIWLHLNPATGNISLSTKAANIDISCRESGDIEIQTGSGNVTIQCTGTTTIKSPNIVFDGDVRVTGNHTVEGKSHGRGGGGAVFSNGIVNERGGFSNTGGIKNASGTVSSNGIVLDTHTHRGDSGGTTSAPNS